MAEVTELDGLGVVVLTELVGGGVVEEIRYPEWLRWLRWLRW